MTPFPNRRDRAALAAIAERHGVRGRRARRSIAAAWTAAAAEHWTAPLAAARRRLLHDLRSTGSATRPALRDAAQLGAVLPVGDTSALERRALAGAVLEGLDTGALASLLGVTRLDAKVALRRALEALLARDARPTGLALVRLMLAGEYATGAVPVRAFAALHRAVALDPDLQRLVAGWDRRLGPLVALGLEPPSPRRGCPVGSRAGLAASVALAVVVAVPTGHSWPPEHRVAVEALPPVAPAAPTTIRRPAPAAIAVPRAEPREPTFKAAPERSSPRRVVAAPALVPARALRLIDAQPLAPRTEPTGDLMPLVHLHYRGDSATAEARARRMGAQLRALALAVDYVPAPGLVVREDRLRFFHASDAGIAAEIVAGLDAAPVLQDFTHYQPRPTVGTLELWLAADG